MRSPTMPHVACYSVPRADGDVGHDVITKAQTDRPAFDPSHYIAGALQNMAHDPGRKCVCVCACVRVSVCVCVCVCVCVRA